MKLAIFHGLALAALLPPSVIGDVGPARPNVLVIVADDLGYSDPGCFGGEIETPRLDALAAQGLRLTQFYTSARCVPSRASLLTGLYAHRAGLGNMTLDQQLLGYRGSVGDDAVTLGEALQAAGYRTFLSGKWHLGTSDPTARGFEEFYGTLSSAGTFWDPAHYLRLPSDRPARAYPPDEFYGTDALADHALDFLDRAATTPDRPWFLYLAFNAPHFPLQARPEDIARYEGRYAAGWDTVRAARLARMKALNLVPPDLTEPSFSDYTTYANTAQAPIPAWASLPPARRADLARRMAIYAAMVDRLDAAVGRVIDRLRARGEFENTLIVFTSDNGACAEWGPYGFDGISGPRVDLHEGAALAAMGGPGTYHSVGAGWAAVSNTPWRLFKHYTHEGGIRVPCIVSWPAAIRARGKLDSTPAHLIDIMPTVLDAAHASYPAQRAGRTTAPPAGESLRFLWSGGALPERELFFEHEGNRAVRAGGRKLVAQRDRPWELYFLPEDPTEERNLAAAQSTRVRELAARWNAWAERQRVLPGPSDFGYTPAK